MPGPRPNILLITTDQQRGDCLSLDPHSPSCLQTPNLDWVAHTGTHFRHGYSECSSCIPARRGLMTGTAPAANGAVGFKSTQWNPPHTLAGELSRVGYQTEMIGKLHLTPIRKRYGYDRSLLMPPEVTTMIMLSGFSDIMGVAKCIPEWPTASPPMDGSAVLTICPKNRCIPSGVLIELWTS